MEPNNQRRWPLALGIIAVVIIISTVMIYTNRINSADKISFQAVSDGRGGVIALWQQGDRIQSQRIINSGKAAWGEKGVLLTDRFTPSNLPWQPQISLIPDAYGGAVATWDDRSAFSDDHNDPAHFSALPVYSQRLNADGTPSWVEGISTGTTRNIGEALTRPVPAGDGGIIFVYNDFKTIYKALYDDYYYLQKVSPEGLPLWGEKGILLYSSPPFRPLTPEEQARGVKGTLTRDRVTIEGFSVVSDQAGGAIVVWREEGPLQDNMTIYAQRYDARGKALWPENGLLVFSAPNLNYKAIADGAGGLLVLNTAENRMAVQRISAGGEFLWPSSGVVIPDPGYYTSSSQIVLHSAGSPVIFWGKMMKGSLVGQDSAIRLDAEGNIKWQRTPLITPGPHRAYHQFSVFSGSDALYLSWCLSEYEFYQTGVSRIMAQKMDVEGNLLWGEQGTAVFPDANLKYQSDPQIVSDGAGGAVILGLVGRSILQGDTVCAQRLDSRGKILWGQGLKINR